MAFITNKNGGGIASDYNGLDNQPSINGFLLRGNKTSEQLGIPTVKVNDVNQQNFNFMGDSDEYGSHINSVRIGGLSYSIDPTIKLINVTGWQNGTLNLGVEEASSKRLRTGFYEIENNSVIEISIKSGYQYCYHYYDASKKYVSNTAWTTSNTLLNASYPFYRFIVSKIDNTDITVEECKNINISIKCESEIAKNINETATKTLSIENIIEKDIISIGSFVHGNLSINDTISTVNLNRISLVKVSLKAMDCVGFKSSLYDKYKFAIDKAGDGTINFILSDNGAYHLKNYTISATGLYNFMISKVDNSDFTQSDITEVNTYFGLVTICGKINNVEYNLDKADIPLNRLSGKKILAIGDSFIDYNTQGLGKDLLSKIALRNNMIQFNYGLSSSSLAYDSNQTVLSVMDRYQQMITEVPNADYVLVLIGHNDSNASLHGGTPIPIGGNTDKINTTFKGALNILIDALITAYPLARILFLSPFNRRGTELPYVDAMKEICSLYSVPFFDNYRGSGVCFQNESHRTYYDLNNTLHLTELGNEFVSYKYEFLLKNM